MQLSVSILAEIPEDLHESLKGFLETHSAWDQDRVYAAALSLFLLQNGHKLFSLLYATYSLNNSFLLKSTKLLQLIIDVL